MLLWNNRRLHGLPYVFIWLQTLSKKNKKQILSKLDIQGEHKNTPWFQVVIKLKLTGIFLKIGGYSCINSYSFMWYHTHTQCAPLLFLEKHRCDNLARTRISAAYPAWPSWQLQWCVPAAHSQLLIEEVHRLYPSRTPKEKIHKRSGPEISGATCTVTTLFVLWNSGTHQHRCCEVSAILHFTALWRRAENFKISW
jgi:hypothetical protein